jgi:hypothetical protein
MKFSAAVVLAGLPLLASAETFLGKYNDVGTHCILVEEGPTQMHRLAATGPYVTRKERQHEKDEKPNKVEVTDDIVEGNGGKYGMYGIGNMACME